MEVRYLRIRVLHICKRESGRRTVFGAVALILSRPFQNTSRDYYLPDSYNILKEKRCTGDSRISIIHKMESEKNRLHFAIVYW